jgi:hypothetical protein
MMDTLKAVAPNLPSSGALNSETEELVPSFMGNLIRHLLTLLRFPTFWVHQGAGMLKP